MRWRYNAYQQNTASNSTQHKKKTKNQQNQKQIQKEIKFRLDRIKLLISFGPLSFLLSNKNKKTAKQMDNQIEIVCLYVKTNTVLMSP